MELVRLETTNGKQKPITTTRIVAEQFGKRHDNVLRALQRLDIFETWVGALKIEESSYVNTQNKEQPEYKLDRDAFMLLTMKFTGGKAEKLQINFIEAFNAMEDKLLSLNTELPVEVQALLRVTREAMEAKSLAQENQRQLKLIRDDIKHTEEYRTIQGFAISKGIQIPKSVAQRWGRRASALSRERGVAIGKVSSENYNSKGSYRVDILEDVWLEYITQERQP